MVQPRAAGASRLARVGRSPSGTLRGRGATLRPLRADRPDGGRGRRGSAGSASAGIGGAAGRTLAGALLLAALVAQGGCQTTRGELVVFTEAQRQRYQLGEPELRALQYYLSDRIVLERVASEGVGEVERGRLIVRKGTAIQQVYIERGTPGVLEPGSRAGAGRPGERPVLEVSFERGAPLRFAADADGTYSLSGAQRGLLSGWLADWGRPRRVEAEFDGATWQVVAGAESRLLIERNALGKVARSRRVLPGVRAPDAR